MKKKSIVWLIIACLFFFFGGMVLFFITDSMNKNTSASNSVEENVADLSNEEEELEEIRYANANGMKLTSFIGNLHLMNESETEEDVYEGRLLSDGDIMETENASYAWMDLDQSIDLKMDESSETVVTRAKGKMHIEVSKGNLFFCVQKMKANESLDFQLSNSVCSIQGTTGVLEIISQKVSHLLLLEGEVHGKGSDGTEFIARTGDLISITTLDHDKCQIEARAIKDEDIPAFVWDEMEKPEILAKIQAGGGHYKRPQSAENESLSLSDSNYNWIVNPSIEADDMYLIRKNDTFEEGGYFYNNCVQYETEYVVLKKGNTLDLIDQSGKYFTGQNIKSIDYYNDEFMIHYISNVDLTGQVEPRSWVPEDATKIKNADTIYFNPVRKQYQMPERGEVGCQDFYYCINGSMYTSFSYQNDNGPFDPGSICVKNSDREFDRSVMNYDDFYFSMPDKFAVFSDGQLKTDFIFDACGGFSDGIAAVKKDGKWGYVNSDGQTVIPFEYDSSWDHCKSDGVAGYQGGYRDACYAASSGYVNLYKNNLWELRNTKGDLLIPSGQFEKILPVYQNKCWVKKDGKWGVIEILD